MLRKGIGRPSETLRSQILVASALLQQDSELYLWLVPLCMLKLHTLVAHVFDFVTSYGCWGIFSEESFEHFQSVSLATRRRHLHNKSLGAQIVGGMFYALLLA